MWITVKKKSRDFLPNIPSQHRMISGQFRSFRSTLCVCTKTIGTARFSTLMYVTSVWWLRLNRMTCKMEQTQGRKSCTWIQARVFLFRVATVHIPSRLQTMDRKRISNSSMDRCLDRNTPTRQAKWSDNDANAGVKGKVYALVLMSRTLGTASCDCYLLRSSPSWPRIPLLVRMGKYYNRKLIIATSPLDTHAAIWSPCLFQLTS